MEIQDEINLTHLGSPRRDTKLSVLLGRVLINQGAADQGALDVRYASDSGEKRTWPMVRVGPTTAVQFRGFPWPPYLQVQTHRGADLDSRGSALPEGRRA